MKKEKKRFYSRMSKMIKRHIDDPWRETRLAKMFKRKKRKNKGYSRTNTPFEVLG